MVLLITATPSASSVAASSLFPWPLLSTIRFSQSFRTAAFGSVRFCSLFPYGHFLQRSPLYTAVQDRPGSPPATTTEVVVRGGHLDGRGGLGRRIWKDRRTGRMGHEGSCTRAHSTLATSIVRHLHLYRMKCPRFGPHNSPLVIVLQIGERGSESTHSNASLSSTLAYYRLL